MAAHPEWQSAGVLTLYGRESVARSDHRGLLRPREARPAGVHNRQVDDICNARGADATGHEAVTPAGPAPAEGSPIILTPLRAADSALMFQWINDRALVLLSAPYRPIPLAEHERWFSEIQQ